MPFLVSVAVFGDDYIAVLVYWESWQCFIQLHKGMMRIREYSYSEPLDIANMLKKQLAAMLPERLIIVPQKAILDHLLLITLHQELHDLVCIAHS